MPNLLLQKLSRNSKTLKEIIFCRYIKKNPNHTSKGNFNETRNLLTNNVGNGVLPLNAQTLSQLVQKHLDSKKAAADDILLHGLLPNIYSERFQPNDD